MSAKNKLNLSANEMKFKPIKLKDMARVSNNLRDTVSDDFFRVCFPNFN